MKLLIELFALSRLGIRWYDPHVSGSRLAPNLDWDLAVHSGDLSDTAKRKTACLMPSSGQSSLSRRSHFVTEVSSVSS